MCHPIRWFLLGCASFLIGGLCKAGIGAPLTDSGFGRRLFPVDHSDPDGQNLFQNDGFTYDVRTVKGWVIGVNIQKSDKSPFTEKEKEAFLRDEGGDWTKDRKNSNRCAELWHRQDGAGALFYSVDDSKSWVVASFYCYPSASLVEKLSH
jgi:hypothetical protein